MLKICQMYYYNTNNFKLIAVLDSCDCQSDKNV